MDAQLVSMIEEHRQWKALAEKGNVAAPFDLAGRFIQWSCDQLSADNQEHEEICLEAAGLSAGKQEDCWAALRLLEKLW